MTSNVSNPDATVVLMPASSDTRECAALKRQLLPLLPVTEEVILDVTAVQQFDTGALQLLFAFVRDRGACGLATRWRGDSKALCNAAAALNLAVGWTSAPAKVGG